MTNEEIVRAWAETIEESKKATPQPELIEKLRVDLDCERMRLAACGVVALSDTPESAANAREMHDDYKSASCDDVARRVDECISLRSEIERLRAESLRRQITIDELNTEVGMLSALHLQAEARCDMQAQQLCAADDIAEKLRVEIAALRAEIERVRDDADRLDWLMRMVSGTEFRRIGIEYSAYCLRYDIDRGMRNDQR